MSENEMETQTRPVDAERPAPERVVEPKASEPAPTETAAEEDGFESKAPTLPENEMSFAEMFELADKQMRETRKTKKEEPEFDVRPGQVLEARVVSVSQDAVFLDLGGKAEGVIPRQEIQGENGALSVKEGDALEVRVRKIENGQVVLTTVPAQQSLRVRDTMKRAHEEQTTLEGRVMSQNKGGYEVEINGLRAFCPSSQIDVRPKKPDHYLGRDFFFRITEFKSGGRNIVVSRRVLLDAERQKRAQEVLSTLSEGQVIQGTITSLKDYGAFVDLGGIEGLVHLSELAHGHLNRASEAVRVGDSIEVQVLKIEPGKDEQQPKISLSAKALSTDPWATAKDVIREGTKHTGKVARIQPFGAFVELLPGVDGLIHVSNMSLDRRVKDPREVVKEGEEIEVTVIAVEWDKRRIGLSLVKTPQELAGELNRGKVYDAKVAKVESFGVFVNLDSGARGLIPAAETGTQRGADLAKEFTVGQDVKVAIIEVEKKSGRIKCSIRAVRVAEERAEYDGFMSTGGQKKQGFGTLGDLLKGALGASAKNSEK
jgi:small subunit ribosomal protein S1